MRRVVISILAPVVMALVSLCLGGHALAAPAEVSALYNVGQWLPADQRFFEQWLAALIAGEEAANRPLAPVIQEFTEINWGCFTLADRHIA